MRSPSCHCEPVLTLVWQSVYSVPRRGCPFLLLVQKKGTKENDTREGKISFSPPPWTLPHSNDQTGLASPFWISPGIRTRSLCGGAGVLDSPCPPVVGGITMRQPKPSPRTGKGDRLRWMRSPRSGLWIHLRRVRWGGRRALSHLSGTGDGSLYQYLLVQKQPIRPIFDVIIIEKQASIKSLIPKTPRGQALGVSR